MNRKPQSEDASWENDAVWKLLDAAPPAAASPRFADDAVRAARLAGQSAAWWKRLFAPVPLAGLTAATAAVAIAITSLQPEPAAAPAPPATATAEPAAFSEIQELAETEILLSAVDHLDRFSDGELVSLIGL